MAKNDQTPTPTDEESLFTLRDISTLTPLMALIRGAHYEQVLLLAGITSADYDVVTGHRLWTGPLRNTARRVLDQLTFAASDAMGFPRIKVPAEYVAMLIGLFVNQLNWMSACNLYQSTTPAETLAARGGGKGTLDEIVNPEQLFALVTKFVAACNYSDIKAERDRIGKAFATGIGALSTTQSDKSV